MGPARFRKLVRRGRGEAIQCLQSNDPEPYLAEITYALTHNTAYEKQCEGSRVGYLEEIAETAGGLVKFRYEIFDALNNAEEQYDFSQLFGFTYLFAKNGDKEAHQLMYERFAARKSKNYLDDMGAGALIELDGADGLIYVAQVIGKGLIDTEESRRIDRPWYAEGILGKDATYRILNAARKQDEFVEAYCHSFEQKRSTANNKCPVRLDATSLSGKEVADLIRTGTFLGHEGHIDLYEWRRNASDQEYKVVAHSLLEEADPQAKLRLLRIFNHRRRFPLKPHLILPLLDSEDNNIADVAAQVLSNFDDANLRTIALENLPTTDYPYRYIYLLRMTYQYGDHLAIENALPYENVDDKFIHSLGFALTDLFEENSTICCLELMLWSYDNNPCSLCRNRAVRILLDEGIAPDWLLEEASFDCQEQTREMVEKYKSGNWLEDENET